MILTEYKHIEVNENNVPVIAGTTMKVVELIASHVTYGWSPEELHFQYPHIALSKIYSALAYYWDRQEEIDTDIQQRFEFAQSFRNKSEESPIVKKLKAKEILQ